MKNNNNQHHKNFLEVLPSKVPSLGVFVESTPDRERHQKTWFWNIDSFSFVIVDYWIGNQPWQRFFSHHPRDFLEVRFSCIGISQNDTNISSTKDILCLFQRPLHHTPVCNGANVIISENFLMEWDLVYVPYLVPISRALLAFLFKKKFHFSSSLFKQKSSLYWSLVHLALFFRLELNGCNTSRKILNDGPVLFVRLYLKAPSNYVFRDPFFHLFFPLLLAPQNDMNNCKYRQEHICLILLILGPRERVRFFTVALIALLAGISQSSRPLTDIKVSSRS